MIAMHVIECISTAESDYGVTLRTRHMVGPFATYEEAHEWMIAVGSKQCVICLIHMLRAPSNAGDQAASLGALIGGATT